MLESYIGITDFTSFAEVERMLALFNAHRKPGSTRLLHVGVMMSYKTLNGLETKWAKAFPPKGTIASIFASSEVMNCLHYANYDFNPNLRHSLAEAIGWGGSGITALQLDMIWPDPEEIRRGIALAKKEVEIILQVGKNSMEECFYDPCMVAKRLEAYRGIIHRVLLDRSMGRGLSMDAPGFIPFAEAIERRLPELGIGAAGGLGPGGVCLVGPLKDRFPNLSIDAQSKLRRSGNALDPIDWDLAEAYLREALELFEG